MASAQSASDRPPTRQAHAMAVKTVLYACRTGRLDITAAEQRLDAVYGARTFGELYAAIAGLPQPPAPLVIGE